MSDIKATYSPSIGDAYAIATAKALDTQSDQEVRLLVGPDDDYGSFEELDEYQHVNYPSLLARFARSLRRETPRYRLV